MRTPSDNLKISVLITALFLLFSACIDSVEPAGPAQYENPDYPATLTGYAVVSTDVSGAFSLNGRLYILDREANIVESFSLSDPCLNFNPSPVDKDTILLDFTPGSYVLDRTTGTMYLENYDDCDVYSIQLPGGIPELLHSSESFITGLFLADNNNSLLICYLGPEWVVRKIDIPTGSNLGEFETGWPITRAAISNDSGELLVSNSSKKFLLKIDVNSMELSDTLFLTQRPGPFLYNNTGNIIVFNAYSIDPRIFLYKNSTGDILQEISSVNSYQTCSLIPGTDVIIAPRKSDDRVSILNSDNMIFAPSVDCMQYSDLAFSTQDGQIMIVLTKNSGRIYAYSHQ